MAPKKTKPKASAAAVSGGGEVKAAPPPVAAVAAVTTAPPSSNDVKLAFELEKKTKPIYEALDVRNYKPALKLIAAAIAKYGNQPILLTLKAVALERTGKRDEALALCSVVQASQPTDLKLLNALTLVYKCADRVHEATVAYENASRREPASHDLALQVYFSYGREHNFARQQTQAMLLYKNWKDVKYLFWSALCMLVQLSNAGTPPGPNNLLTVAEMMIQRTIATRPNDPIEAEHFLIYLRVLLQLQKYDAALQLLASPVAGNFGKLMPHTATGAAAAAKEKEKEKEKSADGKAAADQKERGLESTGFYTIVERKRMEADIYTRLGKHARAAELHHQLLTDPAYGSSDDWLSWNAYFDAQFKLIAGVGSGSGSGSGTKSDEKSPAAAAPDPSVPTPTVSGMLAVVQGLQTAELKLSTPARRGPFLAELELEFRALQAKLSSNSDRLVGLILDYYRRFSSKHMFFWDVQRYLEVLPQPDALKLATAVGPLVAALEPDTKKGYAENRVRRAISAYQLQRYVGYLPLSLPVLDSAAADSKQRSTTADKKSNDSSAAGGAVATTSIGALTELARQLLDEFIASQKLTKNLEPTERGAGDSLCQLCVHVLLDVYDRVTASGSDGRSYLLDALTVLELGLKYSPFNFQFKLLAARLYCHPAIGAALPAFTKHFRGVESRYIQHDSMSHIIMDELVRYGLMNEAISFSGEVVDFHRTHQRDGPEMVTMAYRSTNYSKVLEFAELNDRLQRSEQAVMTRLTHLHCQLAAFAGVTPAVAAAGGAEASGSGGAASDPFSREHYISLLNDGQMLDDVPIPNGSATSVGDIDFDGKLIGNYDYNLLTCWERPLRSGGSGSGSGSWSRLHTQLNRPSPSTYSSSFTVPFDDELVALRSKLHGSAQHQLFEIGSATKAITQFRHLSLVTLRALLTPTAPATNVTLARDGLLRLQSVMSKLKMCEFNVDAPTPTTGSGGSTTAVAAASSSSGPDTLQWRLAYSTLELTATINETVAHSERWLEGVLSADAKTPTPAAADSASSLKDIHSRFAQIKLGLTSIVTYVETIERAITSRLLVSSAAAGGTAASDVLQREKDTLQPKFNPAAVVQLQQFVSHSIRWLAILIPFWESVVLSKKAYRRLHRARQLDEQQQFIEEQIVTEAYGTTRTDLKKTCDAVFDSLQRIVLMLAKYKEQQLKQTAAAKEATSAAPATASAAVATNAAGSVFQSAAVGETEFRVLRAATETTIEDSLRASVVSLLTVIQNCQAPLATLKFS